MAGGQSHRLFEPGCSAVHRIAPECKVAATVAFVLAVVATPREAIWAFGLDAAIIVGVAVMAGIPLTRLARRLVIELPFLAFALFLPFVGGGDQVDVGPLSLSVAGLWGAWNIVIKGTLGVAATAVLGGDDRRSRSSSGASSGSGCRGRSSPSRASWCATAT